MIKEETSEVLTEYKLAFSHPVQVFRLSDGTEVAECYDLTGEAITFNLSLDVK